MGLHMRWRKSSIYGPDEMEWTAFISCEQCGELILDAGLAMYVELPPEPGQDSDVKHVVFTHKGRCLDKLEMNLCGEWYGSDCWELTKFLYELQQNYNLEGNKE